MEDRSLRILLVHNFYQEQGGEDRVFEDEGALLESRGHQVRKYTKHNDAIDGASRIGVAVRTVWSRDTVRELEPLLEESKPDVVHFHNTMPIVSPAAYYAARRSGAAVVQTLHNYRMICPKAVLMRDGKVCEECVGKQMPWPAVKYACYRNDRSATGVLATMLFIHNQMNTWSKQVDLYIALTQFARNKFIQGGLEPEKIVVKPHFVESRSAGRGGGGYALFVGRLSEEKGVCTLLRAWTEGSVQVPLVVVGDGPLADDVREAAEQNRDADKAEIRWLGSLPAEAVYEKLASAAVLIAPSECYETFGRVVVEAYSVGTPVIVSDIGAIGELVEDGRTGYKVPPADPNRLRQAVNDFIADSGLQTQMRDMAALVYQQRYTADRNYEMLLDVYQRAIANRHNTAEGV